MSETVTVEFIPELWTLAAGERVYGLDRGGGAYELFSRSCPGGVVVMEIGRGQRDPQFVAYVAAALAGRTYRAPLAEAPDKP